MKVFIDTNIPMYAAGKEHSFKAPSISLLHAIADGELDAVTDCEVFQEILHRHFDDLSDIERLEPPARP